MFNGSDNEFRILSLQIYKQIYKQTRHFLLAKKYRKRNLEFVAGYDEQLVNEQLDDNKKSQFSMTLQCWYTMNDDIDQNVLSKPANFIDLLCIYVHYSCMN